MKLAVKLFALPNLTVVPQRGSQSLSHQVVKSSDGMFDGKWGGGQVLNAKLNFGMERHK